MKKIILMLALIGLGIGTVAYAQNNTTKFGCDKILLAEERSVSPFRSTQTLCFRNAQQGINERLVLLVGGRFELWSNDVLADRGSWSLRNNQEVVLIFSNGNELRMSVHINNNAIHWAMFRNSRFNRC
jgi:hypothetical protein